MKNREVHSHAEIMSKKRPETMYRKGEEGRESLLLEHEIQL